MRLICWFISIAVMALMGCRKAAPCMAGGIPSLGLRWQAKLPGEAYLYPTPLGADFLLSWHGDEGQHFATLSRQDGSVKAQWRCNTGSPTPLYYNLMGAFSENKLLLPAPRSILAITPGKCLALDTPFESGEPALTVHDGIAYRVYYDEQHRRGQLTAQYLNGDSLRVFATRTAPAPSVIFFKNPLLCSDEQTGRVVVAGYTEYDDATRLTRNGVLRISLPEGRTLSDQALTPPNREARGLNQQPVAYRNLSFWTVQQELICFDHVHNSVRWRRQMPAPMVTSRLLVHEGSLYFAAEDGKLYALALPSGALRWSATISGSPGRVFPAGKFLFVVGGSDGVLYGINSDNGEVVVKQRSPQHNISKGIFYQRTCYADENGVLLFDGNTWQYFSANMPCDPKTPTLPASGK